MMWRAVRVVLATALVAALVLVIVLARQNADLVRRVALLERRAFEPYPGLQVPTVTATTLDGTALTLGEREDGARQLLLVFTTTCPYCKASLPSWRQIAAAADTLTQPRPLVAGIVLDSGDAAAYGRAHSLQFPIARFPSRKVQSMYRVRSVPAVVLLDGAGQVIYARTGVLESRVAVDSVLAALRWTQPGVDGAAPPPRGVRRADTP